MPRGALLDPVRDYHNRETLLKAYKFLHQYHCLAWNEYIPLMIYWCETKQLMMEKYTLAGQNKSPAHYNLDILIS